MEQNFFLKPATGHIGSVRTDLPLTVATKGWLSRSKLTKTLCTGQLLCVGKVYVKTHKGLIRIR
ncbi:MAG: hypothetical protein JSW23_03400 [Planctomycetota bacterium]|nr:MAG: hypothetical protein JSW23_03400 [Planctomycetota bacterium]